MGFRTQFLERVFTHYGEFSPFKNKPSLSLTETYFHSLYTQITLLYLFILIIILVLVEGLLYIVPSLTTLPACFQSSSPCDLIVQLIIWFSSQTILLLTPFSRKRKLRWGNFIVSNLEFSFQTILLLTPFRKKKSQRG